MRAWCGTGTPWPGIVAGTALSGGSISAAGGSGARWAICGSGSVVDGGGGSACAFCIGDIVGASDAASEDIGWDCGLGRSSPYPTGGRLDCVRGRGSGDG